MQAKPQRRVSKDRSRSASKNRPISCSNKVPVRYSETIKLAISEMKVVHLLLHCETSRMEMPPQYRKGVGASVGPGDIGIKKQSLQHQQRNPSLEERLFDGVQGLHCYVKGIKSGT